MKATLKGLRAPYVNDGSVCAGVCVRECVCGCVCVDMCVCVSGLDEEAVQRTGKGVNLSNQGYCPPPLYPI